MTENEPAGGPPRFLRLLRFRTLDFPDKELRVLEDSNGWLYVLRLWNTPDFGPYTKAEIAMAFQVEAEPWYVTERPVDFK